MTPVVLVAFLCGCDLYFEHDNHDAHSLDDDSPGFADAAAGDSQTDADGATATSCVGLTPICGANNTEPCCGSPLVAAGSFFRNYDVANDAAFKDMSHPATVSDFRLDSYEVTVGRFRAFVAAGKGTQLDPPATDSGAHPHVAASGWEAIWNDSLAVDTTSLVAGLACDPMFATWTESPGANEARPINCITWYEAMAFCTWDGGYLPSEAEWNYAAAGGLAQRAYPWSNPASSLVLNNSYASYYVDGTRECLGDGLDGCAVTDLVVVGSKSAGNGRWGQSDLTGNVREWVLDHYWTLPDPCNDCANLTQGEFRVMRGGNFETDTSALRVAYPNATLPQDRQRGLGVRCARAP
jgi:formylglycine-generating enzyme required for sulfatase activity